MWKVYMKELHKKGNIIVDISRGINGLLRATSQYYHIRKRAHYLS